MKKTQKQIVIDKLQADGYVDNLWAISHFMLRLGAIICQLGKEGWEFESDYIPGTKNFKYKVTRMPITLRPELFVKKPVVGDLFHRA